MASKKPMTAKIILSEAFANKEVGDVLELNPVLAASIVSRGVAKYYKAETVTTVTTEIHGTTATGEVKIKEK